MIGVPLSGGTLLLITIHNLRQQLLPPLTRGEGATPQKPFVGHTP